MCCWQLDTFSHLGIQQGIFWLTFLCCLSTYYLAALGSQFLQSSPASFRLECMLSGLLLVCSTILHFPSFWILMLSYFKPLMLKLVCFLTFVINLCVLFTNKKKKTCMFCLGPMTIYYEFWICHEFWVFLSM